MAALSTARKTVDEASCSTFTSEEVNPINAVTCTNYAYLILFFPGDALFVSIDVGLTYSP